MKALQHGADLRDCIFHSFHIRELNRELMELDPLRLETSSRTPNQGFTKTAFCGREGNVDIIVQRLAFRSFRLRPLAFYAPFPYQTDHPIIVSADFYLL